MSALSSWRPRVVILWLALGIAMAAALSGCGGGGSETGGDSAQTPAKRPLVLATTTSTQDSGLLDELIPAFEQDSGYTVKTVAVGSGQAIEMGHRGEADVVLAHSPQAEQELMASGVAGDRRIVMHNDFVIIGPRDDPAQIKGERAAQAVKDIADQRRPFVSRGDDSGTNAFELKLWEQDGIEPHGAWYQKTGQGMGATLQVAAEKDAYTITDRGTYLSTTQGKSLPILVDGGPGLLNVYHVMDITKRAGPRVNVAGGRAFADWIVSAPVQKAIGDFGRERYGDPLFTPDAGKTEAQVQRSS